MTEPDPERDYKYLDMEELRATPLEPVEDPCDVVLHNALLDIIQLAEESGMSVDEVDGVLRGIIDDRAVKVRSKFTLHIRDAPE